MLIVPRLLPYRKGWNRVSSILIFFDCPRPTGWFRQWFLFDERQAQYVPFMNSVFETTPTNSNTTHTSPSDWNNNNNVVECIGAGASGGCVRGNSTNCATGGGGGAYSLIKNYNFTTPGTTQYLYNLG